MITLPPAAHRDGQRDFDFFDGTWRIHNRRLKNPLTGSSEWYEFEGHSVARQLWSGRGNMDEAIFDSPVGRIEGCTIRFYSEDSRHWSLYWATSKNGLAPIPMVGSFNDAGMGEFFARELFDGRDIICRFRWSEITEQSCRWDQAFSVDECVTWETNWIMEFSRI